jgi:kinesin family protein 4/21/27
MVHVTSPTSVAVDVPQGRKLFVFDRVFPETVEQDGVWEYLNDSVNSFIQGYNVSILAYGQSGAGKSYTMGTSGEQENSGAMGELEEVRQEGENYRVRVRLANCNFECRYHSPRCAGLV